LATLLVLVITCSFKVHVNDLLHKIQDRLTLALE